MGSTERVGRAACLREGVAAGAALFLADALAAGAPRPPALLWAASLLAFAAGGLAAGALGALTPRRGVAAGAALAGALLVQGLSVASKELSGAERAAGFASAVVAALAFGALAALALSRARDGRAARLVLAAACVPAASLAAWALPRSPGAAAAHVWLAPAVALALALAARALRPRAALALAALALAALALPARVVEVDPPRRFVPGPRTAEAAPDAPDVVLLLIDTLRADAFDERSAPELSRFFAGGARFPRCVTSGSWTLPSTSSILTSLHPVQHGAVQAERGLPGSVTTLAEAFRAAGYETVAFTGGGFVSPAFGLDQGFDWFDPWAELSFRPFRAHVPLFWRAAKNRYLPLRPLLARVNEFGGTRELGRRVRVWLAEREPDRPWLLLLHTYQVHDYYIYHPEPDAPLRAAGGVPEGELARRLSVHPSELLGATQEELDWFRRVYEGRIAYVDGQLGLLLEELERAAGARGLVTALSSDHGEGFDAARRRVHHGERLHDDLTSVPLLLRAPGRLPELAAPPAAPARSVDLMPTLLDLCGLPVPEGLAGTSLLPALTGAAPFPAPAFSEEHNARADLRAVRTPGWKLIETRRGEELTRETYRLDRDPLEAHPLERAPDALLRELATFEERWPPRPPEESELDPATRQHLRDLGYVE